MCTFYFGGGYDSTVCIRDLFWVAVSKSWEPLLCVVGTWLLPFVLNIALKKPHKIAALPKEASPWMLVLDLTRNN